MVKIKQGKDFKPRKKGKDKKGKPRWRWRLSK